MVIANKNTIEIISKNFRAKSLPYTLASNEAHSQLSETPLIFPPTA